VDYIESVTGMTPDELVAVSQDRDVSDRTATKQFLITWNRSLMESEQKTLTIYKAV